MGLIHYRSRWLPLFLTAWCWSASVAWGQSIRQVYLDPATGRIDRRYLPAGQTFDFLIRAASELRELRGEYCSASGAKPKAIDPWIRRGGIKSKDATLRIEPLSPGATYCFRFILVRRPTGNEGRLMEAAALDVLRDAFRRRPADSIHEVAALAAPLLRKARDSVLPRSVAVSPSPLTGDPADVAAALNVRGVDRLQEDYRRRLALVGTLRSQYLTARDSLAREPGFARTVNTLTTRVARRPEVAELAAPLESCRAMRDSTVLRGSDSTQLDLNQLALLGTLKQDAATIGTCGALLRDVRLPQYAALRKGPRWARSDVLTPAAYRLEALRSETEGLLALWRKREGTLAQVASDIRRGLDSGVTWSDTVDTLLQTEPSADLPPRTTLGIALVGTLAPCTVSNSCVRVVPAVTLGFRLAGLVGAEVGFTLADTDAPGRTQHLFWFSSGMTGVSVRLGPTGHQRIGAGALILRRAEADDFDSFRLGGYLSFTVYDFRL